MEIAHVLWKVSWWCADNRLENEEVNGMAQFKVKGLRIRELMIELSV